MGSILSQIFYKFVSKTPVRILMVGLDAAGKTAILYRMKLNEVVTTIPTIGFNRESVEYKNISFTVWDMGSQYINRPLWRQFFSDTQWFVQALCAVSATGLTEGLDWLSNHFNKCSDFPPPQKP